MIALYVVFLFVLGALHLIISRRVASLEKKYTKVARETEELLREPRRQGNSNNPDAYMAARQAYLLGQSVEKRERLEVRYLSWQRWADALGNMVKTMREWKGRKAPYALGVLDVLITMGVLDYFGYHDQFNARALVEFLTQLAT